MEKYSRLSVPNSWLTSTFNLFGKNLELDTYLKEETAYQFIQETTYHFIEETTYQCIETVTYQ